VAIVVWPTTVGVVVIIGGGWVLTVLALAAIGWKVQERSLAGKTAAAEDPLAFVLEEARVHGGGVYLGLDEHERWRSAQPERAVLLLGPPRSGKSSGVMIPALLSHRGAVVSTSTKPDVMRATIGARSRLGPATQFDPTGSTQVTGDEGLRWSPIPCSRSWDGALLMARAMVAGTGVGAGTTDQTHWAKRATALLAPLLHAAALTGRNVEHVLDWVLRHEVDEPGILIEGEGSNVALGLLRGLQNTEARERSSIFSTAADALDAYTSEAALRVAFNPNFEAARFVRSSATIYIHAPAEHQAAAAPLVCGLLAEIRREVYEAHRRGELRSRVLFALDEAANIAPLVELPAIASEGGSQGLQLGGVSLLL
jgi:type IV secretory pathway TraG/TraD family ATPase VirD4